MAFDKPTRNRLAAFVAEARRLITDEFTRQFQSLYGIAETSLTPLDQLGHLDDAGLAVAGLLRERIDYLVRTHPEDKAGLKTAVARLAREQAFTVLNRLAAVRMAEKRGLIIESVGSGYQSKGFKVFEQVARSGLGEIYQRYRRYLFCLFDELAVDLGVLFDRRSPQGLLFPGEKALLALLDLLNGPELEPLWQEDETIGWIYQYYNDPAERKKMREESAAPRNSRELAVRNQFFTPRYVVEFLTDNTLGRIWYEMTRGETRLKEQCRYLVRRPTEIFLGPGETTPELPEQEGLSQEELLRQPVYVPHRALKDPRELRMLDPACGSMHFGLYAFDLYEVIYAEAWDRGIATLRADFPERDALVREIPRLIIEHNIHGIDIDPRAVQIAGLSLWLRAQRSWQEQRLPAGQRPRIRRANIVCAEPMPGDKLMLREFIASQFTPEEQPAFTFLLERVFDRMTLAGEAGSLLKIEEEISEAVREAKGLWQKGPQYTPGYLFAEAMPKQPKQLQLNLSGISDEGFWETAEGRIYLALETYANQAGSDGYHRRLFAADAAEGFAFIDLCRKCYDVLLMNPPFGEFLPTVLNYVYANLPGGRNDIYSAMILRLVDCLMVDQGRLGAISSRAFVVGRDLLDFRKALIREDGPHLSVFLDLGAGILDGAMVETAAYTVSSESRDEIIHSNSRSLKENERFERINEDDWKVIPISMFRSITGNQFLFGIDTNSLESLQGKERFIPNFAEVTQGLVTEDNTRFLRLRWEVPALEFGNTWFIFAKGGEYSWFTGDLHLVVKRLNDGEEMAAFAKTNSGNVARTRQSSKFYGIPGATYSGRSQKGFSCRRLRAEACFSNKSGVVFPAEKDTDKWCVVLPLVFASESYLQLIDAQAKFGSYEVGSIKMLPRPDLHLLHLYDVATTIYWELDTIEQNIEISCLFVNPQNRKYLFEDTWERVISLASEALLSLGLKLRGDVADFQKSNARYLEEDFGGLSALISYSVGALFGRWDIRYATGERSVPELPNPFAPLPVCPPGMLQGEDGLPLAPKAGRQLRAAGHYPLDIAWGGILVDDPGHTLDLERHLREVFTVLWGDRAEAIEQEACEFLNVESLRDYFRKPSGFFADHLKRYSKSRRQAPIYWPLSTAKGSYTLWIYYHRLSEQTLHTALADFFDPKLKDVRAEISLLREENTSRGRLEELLDLEGELLDFRAEIERIIKLPWQPNLNDGVLITAAPLWPLFRLPKWRKDLKACWDKLEKGDYDWAHLAYTIWPKRVEEVCKTDRSIAIAHGLEHLCQAEPPKPKAKRGRKKKAE